MAESQTQLDVFSDSIKSILLDYLLSRPLDDDFNHLIGVPLIPINDNGWRALEYLSSLKLPVDEDEQFLFNKNRQTNININRLSKRAFRKLKILQLHGMYGLQPWRIEDVPEYCTATYFADISGDSACVRMSVMDPDFPDFVAGLWKWISKTSSNDIRCLENLWLIPLIDDSYQRIVIAEPEHLSLDHLLSRPLLKYEPFSGFLEQYSIRKLVDIMVRPGVSDKDSDTAIGASSVADRLYPENDNSTFNVPDWYEMLYNEVDLITEDPHLSSGTASSMRPTTPKETIDTNQPSIISTTEESESDPGRVGLPGYSPPIQESDAINDYLENRSPQSAFSLMLAYVEAQDEAGTSLVEWRLEYGVTINTSGESELSPRLFFITDSVIGGKALANLMDIGSGKLPKGSKDCDLR